MVHLGLVLGPVATANRRPAEPFARLKLRMRARTLNKYPESLWIVFLVVAVRSGCG